MNTFKALVELQQMIFTSLSVFMVARNPLTEENINGQNGRPVDFFSKLTDFFTSSPGLLIRQIHLKFKSDFFWGF